MRILLVAATATEIAPVVAGLSRAHAVTSRLHSCHYNDHEIDVLTTGVGMVATAVWCSDRLARERYDMAVNLGVCGTFDASLPLGGAVHVVADCLAELGAEDGERFLSIEDLGLLAADEFPFHQGRLVNSAPPANAALQAIPSVSGITVNTVHGDAGSIARVVERLRPQVESMEGAAFMYACTVHRVPFAQVRVVSNVVEPRNRAAWKLPEAIAELGRIGGEILAAS